MLDRADSASIGLSRRLRRLPSSRVSADPELEMVERAFNAAFARMCGATREGELHDELSNCLHQVYRLGELCKARLGKTQFYGATRQLRETRAALWVRNCDTHHLVSTASLGDIYSDYYTEMYGVPVWEPLAVLPTAKDAYGRDADYRTTFEGRPVLDTLRRSFDDLASIMRPSASA